MVRGSWWIFGALLLGCSASGAEPPRRHMVDIRGFRFVPAALRVAAGDTVVFVNRDGVPHTATSSSAGFDTGDIAAGKSRAIVVGGQGDQPYVCAYHPGMKAQLDVR